MASSHDTTEHGHGHGAHHAPPLPEPHTPMWLPALGATLFLLAGIWWALSTSDSPKEGAASPKPTAAAAPATATGAPAKPAAPTRLARPAAAPPAKR